MPEEQASREANPAWVPVSLVGRKVTDVDGALVTLEFTLDLPDDNAWYQCFAQARGPERHGSATFTSTNPQFVTAELLSWKVELSDIPDAVAYLVGRVAEANHDFIALLERKEQIRRQLEEAARRREQAIAEAQRLLDASWPAVEATEAPGSEGTESAESAAEKSDSVASRQVRPQAEQVARSAPVARGSSGAR
jgi:hypothetical protein